VKRDTEDFMELHLDDDDGITGDRIDTLLSQPLNSEESHVRLEQIARAWRGQGGDGARVHALLKRAELAATRLGPDYSGDWADFEEEDSCWGRLAGAVLVLTGDTSWTLELCSKSLMGDRFTDQLLDTYALLSGMETELTQPLMVSSIECCDGHKRRRMLLALASSASMDPVIIVEMFKAALAEMNEDFEDIRGDFDALRELARDFPEALALVDAALSEARAESDDDGA